MEKLASARARLAEAGISNKEAAIDVDLFARTILGWDRARLLTEQRTTAPVTLEPLFSDWVARRAAREPSAYIVGVREFWGRDFHVTPAVLIPRPETEFIVEETLAILRTEPRRLARAGHDGREGSARIRIADIGTGCGCIAISLALEATDSQIVATDVSPEALAVARANAVRHAVADHIEFVQTSYLADVDEEFDVIAANPPYVRDRDKPALSRDVRHEPDVALFGGATGLGAIEGVLDAATTKLRAGGWLVMEFGFGQEDDVRERVEDRRSLRLDHVREDLQGLPRTAIIQRR